MTASVTKATFVETIGCWMYLNDEDRALTPNIRRGGVWEPLQTQVVAREIMPGHTVLDIGANVGYYTLLLAKRVGPQGKVIAFEPEPVSLSLLRQNLRLNKLGNVTIVPAAVSSTSGRLPLHIAEQNKGTHSLAGHDDTRSSLTVDAVSLDEHFRDYAGSVDFIKMDIEGAEAQALSGMGNLLYRNAHCRLLTEFSPRRLQQCGSDAGDYLEALLAHGFHLYVLDEHDQRIAAADVEELLRYRRDSGDDFTNLFCSPHEWTWKHWLAHWRTGWAERLDLARSDLAGLVPRGETVVLIDDDTLGERATPPGRRAIPFLERNGEYAGPPVDDAHAVRELERLEHAGAGFVAVAWPSFWWLDFYPAFASELRARSSCVLENDRVIGFELIRDGDEVG